MNRPPPVHPALRFWRNFFAVIALLAYPLYLIFKNCRS